MRKTNNKHLFSKTVDRSVIFWKYSFFLCFTVDWHLDCFPWCPGAQICQLYMLQISFPTPGVTGKFGLGMWNEAGQRLIRVLSRKCTGHSKHPLPTTQEKTLHMDITRWSTAKSDWLYSLQPKMEKLYTVNKNKTRSWLWLRSWTPYYQIQT